MLNNENLEELAQATSIKLNLSQFAVEKDFYLTKAIYALTQLNNNFFELVFQGGTSLSKGYKAIQRLSEDADFRIIQKESALKLGKESRRKRLRKFRYSMIQTLKSTGFQIPDNAVRVFYEGRFMNIQAEFPNSIRHSYLKPHIAVECFLGELALPHQTKNITTLIKQTLGDPCIHEIFSVNCVALDETAAEKWVALTRRVANTEIKTRNSDKHLVRHLYDLYRLSTSQLLIGNYTNIAHKIIEKDRVQFANQNAEYVKSPIETSKSAINALYENSNWEIHWNNFLNEMVFDEYKPTFKEAYEQLREISDNIFNHA